MNPTPVMGLHRMVTETQVRSVFDDARAFYKGQIKSSNKAYAKRPDETYTAKQQKRIDNQEESSRLYESRRKEFAGKTILEVGSTLYKRVTRDGNCGEMAAVAMFIALDKHNVADTEAVHVTAFNKSHTKFLDGRGGFSGSKLTFGHSWLRLGPRGGAGWIVDPWAAVCCGESEQQDATLKTLANWASQNKRIFVQWEDGGGKKYSRWTPATDDSVQALFASGATRELWYPNEKTPVAG